MKIIDCIQGDDKWFELHQGRPTAGRFSRIITPKKWSYASGAQTFIHKLVAGQYVPEWREDYTSAAMKNGMIMEPEARRYYEFDRDVTVQKVGFCMTDCERFGCSPDGLVEGGGGLELKSPEPETQVKYLLDGGVPAEYLPQVHGCLLVTGLDWWDFMSYCPPFPTLLVRVEPDEKTEALRLALDRFWEEYQAAIEKVKGLFRPEPTKTMKFGDQTIEIGALAESPF